MTSQRLEIKLERSVYPHRFITTLSNKTNIVSMTSDNLQQQYRETLDETLNQLQSVTLLIAQIEAKMDDVRESMQSLCEIMESIIATHPSD
jgi:predicted transcriptional regulator